MLPLQQRQQVLGSASHQLFCKFKESTNKQEPFCKGKEYEHRYSQIIEVKEEIQQILEQKI